MNKRQEKQYLKRRKEADAECLKMYNEIVNHFSATENGAVQVSTRYHEIIHTTPEDFKIIGGNLCVRRVRSSKFDIIMSICGLGVRLTLGTYRRKK